MSNFTNDEMSPFMVVGGADESEPLIPGWLWGVVVLAVLLSIYIFVLMPGEWQTSKWSECTAVCGGGTQTREVTCDFGNCDPAVKPDTTQTCGTEPCWSKTSAVGGAGGNPYDFKCPDGQYVNKIYYKADVGLNHIGVRCSGSKMDEATSNLYGGSGGSPGNFEFANGIDSFYVTGNKFIGNINPGTNSKVDFTKGGKALGVERGEGQAQKLECSPGSKIAGVYGRYGSLTDKLGFNCYKFT
jgi:hypothetical protein